MYKERNWEKRNSGQSQSHNDLDAVLQLEKRREEKTLKIMCFIDSKKITPSASFWPPPTPAWCAANCLAASLGVCTVDVHACWCMTACSCAALAMLPVTRTLAEGGELGDSCSWATNKNMNVINSRVLGSKKWCASNRFFILNNWAARRFCFWWFWSSLNLRIGKKHIADLRGIIPQHSVRHKWLSVQTQKQATHSAFWTLTDVENQSVYKWIRVLTKHLKCDARASTLLSEKVCPTPKLLYVCRRATSRWLPASASETPALNIRTQIKC